MGIPFVDLKSQYQSLQPEIDAAIQSVLNDTAFVGGKYVEASKQLLPVSMASSTA